jgi:abortive infection bacteriophage resistance protein
MSARKPFLTYEQQLDMLVNEKGLSVSDRSYAENMLKQIGYFTLIGGYKEPFRNPTTKKYKDGTTFDEIVALYEFDKRLRELFLKYILVVESKMRSLLSYYFTEKYGEDQGHYLTPSSYSADPNKTGDIIKLISVLGKLALNPTDYRYITYQQRNYGNVPLWVLVRALTFGNLSFMYKCFP